MENNQSGPAENTGRAVLVERMLHAPRELVFQAWTDPRHLIHWWAPKDFVAFYCTVDFRIGGCFRYGMRGPGGEEIWGQGIYREIVVPERIVYGDTFTDEKGRPVPPSHYGMALDSLAESVVEVRFDEADGNTRLTIRYTSFTETGRELEMAEQGWNEMVDRLIALLEKP